MTWGEGTGDEMCLAYLTLIRDEPLAEPKIEEAVAISEDGEACHGIEACLAECDDILCRQACANQQSAGCEQCYFTGIFACGTLHCSEVTDAITGCTLGCLLAGEDPETCGFLHCLPEYMAFQDCIQPRVEAGACNDTLARCNVKF